MGDHRIRPAAHCGPERQPAVLVLHHPQANLGLRQRDHVVQQPAADLHLSDRHGGHGSVGRRGARVALHATQRPDRRARLGVDHGVDLVPGWADHLLRRRDWDVSGEDLHGDQAAALHDHPRGIRVRKRAGRSGRGGRSERTRPTTPVSSDRLRGQARDYYEGKLRAHGPTPAGVDWNSQESQELRFALLANLWRDEADASILDYGCGYGALADYLRARGHRGAYTGYDV